MFGQSDPLKYAKKLGASTRKQFKFSKYVIDFLNWKQSFHLILVSYMLKSWHFICIYIEQSLVKLHVNI